MDLMVIRWIFTLLIICDGGDGSDDVGGEE